MGFRRLLRPVVAGAPCVAGAFTTPFGVHNDARAQPRPVFWGQPPSLPSLRFRPTVLSFTRTCMCVGESQLSQGAPEMETQKMKARGKEKDKQAAAVAKEQATAEAAAKRAEKEKAKEKATAEAAAKRAEKEEAKKAAAAAKAEAQAEAAAKRIAEQEKAKKPSGLTLAELGGEPTPDARGQWVFLVTLAALNSGLIADTHPESATALKDPNEASRQEILDALLDAVTHAAPVPGSAGRRREVPLKVEKAVVFQEEHDDGRRHFHIALKLNSVARFVPLKQAMRERSGYASHWSCSHSMWWSALRYGVFTSARKPVVDDAPLIHSPGKKLNLVEESQEPFMAKALKRRREEKEVKAGGKKQALPKFTKLDFTALVLAKNIKTKEQAIAYATKRGSACGSRLGLGAGRPPCLGIGQALVFH